MKAENPPPDIEQAILSKGREIFSRMEGAAPRAFSRKSLIGQLMDWSMRRENLKVQLFRLVDVLPVLDDPREIAEHARDYLLGADDALPPFLRAGLEAGAKLPRILAAAARQGVRQMANNFILAPDADDAIPALRRMREKRLAFTADILGETVLSEREADHYQQRYLHLIERLAEAAQAWPRVERLDADDRGPIPKVNVSVKISALYSQIHPAAPEDAIEHLGARLRPLLRLAREREVFINFDMEHYALKDMTLALFKRIAGEPEFVDYPHLGIVIQAYLRDSERDLRELIAWASEQGCRVTVRLVKGAYWDTETLLARQRNWPVPVFDHKQETDANYEALAALMLENPQAIDCAFGTHNVRSIAACIARAEALGRDPCGYEIQMLYGMAEPIKQALVQMGHRVREYCPIGEILPGMSYLVRRLLENTSNEGFLRATFSEGAPVEELLRDPKERQPLESLTWPEPPFRNEPNTDFTRAAARRQMQDALRSVRARMGQHYPLLIGEKEVRTGHEAPSLNPARPSEAVGVVGQAGIPEADAAIAAGKAAFPYWSRMTPDARAAILERAAELIREARFEIAALEVFEVGKNWEEADADVSEAIDFCRFYAGEMRRIASATYPVPGELNVHEYTARGLAVIIAPWNFPLAILCGMTAAALAAGNCAIMKPSEQSAVLGARLARVFREAGVPPGAIQFLAGPGETVGAYLVEHPDVALIAFTGSKEVGLKIWETAGRTAPQQLQLKKVVCEMGGKNAIIVDADADLDEATPAILASAFGYQGQKCSAASRLIVLEPIYERLIDRLIDAASSLSIGPPEASANLLGPVIDEEAFQRIKAFIEDARKYAVLAYAGATTPGEGYFIGPTIFRDVPPDSPLAQEEIFGPVLAVIRARDLDEALRIANGTKFALTGGFFSRSPRNIERVKRGFEVGNLYINRGITGAIVGRHPFGGARMSGGGTKAGGRDYLLNFLLPRVVTENLIRRGFVSPERTADRQHGHSADCPPPANL
jgi:RHH-type proline utilization regulon transcriptional repressor/proline dehydrogenase/delta 1-pyrroline-5-carboxylate dehydrogenase